LRPGLNLPVRVGFGVFSGEDLSHILLRYQNQGIKVFLCDGIRISRVATVSEPSRFMSLFYRTRVTLGLSRNAAGGFGAIVPDPHRGSSYGGFYGYG
jgi:hypothetical protein